MINYFRASLVNLAADTEHQKNVLEDVDFLPYAYTPVTLSSRQQALSNLLFPDSSRTGKLLYTNAYTSLLRATNLDSVFTLFYPTISYKPADLESFNNIYLASHTISLPTVYHNIETAKAGHAFFKDTEPGLYSDMYDLAIPNMLRLAALVGGYTMSRIPA